MHDLPFGVLCFMFSTSMHAMRAFFWAHPLGTISCNTCYDTKNMGGPSPQFGYATPPPPHLPALWAHLVTKGQ